MNLRNNMDKVFLWWTWWRRSWWFKWPYSCTCS